MQLSRLIEKAAHELPNKIATVCSGRQHSWSAFQQRVAKLAGAFQSLGLKPGDRVALLALNSDRYLETTFAAFWADAVIVPMNIRWSKQENLYSIDDSGPKVLLVDDLFLDQAHYLLKESSHVDMVIHMGESETPEGFLNYEQLLEKGPSVAMGQRGGGDLAGIFYTGGTTGYPKGVMLSHANLLHSGLYISSNVNYSSDEVYLHAAPMYHLADGSQTVSNTLCGATHCFIPSFDPLSTMQAIASMNVTSTVLVPTMLQMIVDHPQFQEFDLSSLKRVTYGGSPMPTKLLEKIIVKLPGLELIQGYGQTEMAPVISLLMPEDHCLDGPKAKRLTSVGRAVMGVDIKIVDENLSDKPVGEIGQIVARGGNAMLGYWNNPEQSAATLHDGWVLTGDAGYLDSDSYLYLVDRVKDMIISGGENVYSVEVENALSSHPDVEMAAVIGIASEEWGEEVHGIVIADPSKTPTEEQLIQHCKQLIAGYKCPKKISFRRDPMPLSGAGKILKTELRKLYTQ